MLGEADGGVDDGGGGDRSSDVARDEGAGDGAGPPVPQQQAGLLPDGPAEAA